MLIMMPLPTIESACAML